MASIALCYTAVK